MPWEVRAGSPKCPQARPYAVIKSGTGELEGCHETEAKAQAQVAALYASEGKAVWSAAFINDLPDSSFAYIESGGEKDEQGKTVPRSLRHFPIKDAAGRCDAAHTRNALARAPQSPFGSKAMPKIEACAQQLKIGEFALKAATELKAEALSEDRMAAWFAGRIPRRLLAIPFGGPVPHPGFARGVDLDGETFTERTDIKPTWLEFRVTDWHHGKDATMGRTVIGKADALEMDEDGWWVDLWLDAGEKRLELVKRLVDRGGVLYGSSESISGMVRKADTGEILAWPYWRQTLTTSPQNVYSALRPVKAVLTDAVTDDNASSTFWADVAAELSRLGMDLHATSPKAGEAGATDGPTQDLDKALQRLDLISARLRDALP